MHLTKPTQGGSVTLVSKFKVTTRAAAMLKNPRNGLTCGRLFFSASAMSSVSLTATLVVRHSKPTFSPFRPRSRWKPSESTQSKVNIISKIEFKIDLISLKSSVTIKVAESDWIRKFATDPIPDPDPVLFCIFCIKR